MPDIYASRPIRKTATDISDGSVTVFGTSTRVSTITVTPLGGDVVVNFRNGLTGDILWSVEADNASGSHSVSFDRYPILFTQGVVAEVNSVDFVHSICVAVVEPQASGTS